MVHVSIPGSKSRLNTGHVVFIQLLFVDLDWDLPLTDDDGDEEKLRSKDTVVECQ